MTTLGLTEGHPAKVSKCHSSHKDLLVAREMLICSFRHSCLVHLWKKLLQSQITHFVLASVVYIYILHVCHLADALLQSDLQLVHSSKDS